MMGEISNDAFRRVVWSQIRTDAALEFCELKRNGANVILAGKIVGAADGRPAFVSYQLACTDDLSRCRSVSVECVVGADTRTLRLDQASDGRWLRNGAEAQDLDDCDDPDLEWSPSTNLFPIRRLPQQTNAKIEIKAAWIRLPSLAVEVARQSYTRLGKHRARYRNEQSGFEAVVEVDADGLPINYERIWTRIADWRVS